jgi:hypothetical protein
MGQLELLKRFSRCLMLGTLLEEARQLFGGYELLEHWPQGIDSCLTHVSARSWRQSAQASTWRRAAPC